MASFFSLAKQSIFEKIGKADKTVDSPEVCDALKRLEDISKQTNTLLKLTTALAKSNADASKAEMSYANMLKEHSLQEIEPNKTLLEKIAGHHASTEQSRAHLAKVANDTVQVLRNFIDTDICNAEEAVKRYKHARLEYDSAKSDFADLAVKKTEESKLQHAQNLMDTNRDTFEKAGFEVATYVESLEQRRKFSVLTQLHQLGQARAKSSADMISEGMLLSST